MVLSRQVADVLSGYFRKNIRAGMDSPSLFFDEYRSAVYEEAARYKGRYHVRRIKKYGSPVSGDNFSVKEYEDGRLVMMLSDGMGSGSLASCESCMMLDTMEELLKLPGVGRKTANLILGDVYHTPGVVVADTHCIRISGLLGLTDGTKDPGKVEQQLRAILPPEESNDFCHRLVLHGRAVCIARRPQCQSCVLRPWCDHFAKSGQTARGTEGREPA